MLQSLYLRWSEEAMRATGVQLVMMACCWMRYLPLMMISMVPWPRAVMVEWPSPRETCCGDWKYPSSENMEASSQRVFGVVPVS